MSSRLTDVAEAKGDSAFGVQRRTCIEHPIAYEINRTRAVDSLLRNIM